ncbi:MAG: carbonic anhydrase [Deltaproteobacteria bacterium]|nr:carbonic anhydrase [Deltaproteobacteria bacterium]
MKKLLDGIHRFQSGVFGAQRELFSRLSKGQDPDALFITCSDSRINPNLVTQTDPGDLFIIRNAGNLVPAYGPFPGGEAATIEYAIEVLGVKDVIICGHTHCGAMKSILDPTGLDELPAVKGWLTHADGTRRIMRTLYKDLPHEAQLETCIEENVLVQIENLRTHPSVLAALTRGEMTLHAWVYEIETGIVDAFEAETGQFQPISQAGKGIAEKADRLGGRRQI